MILKHFHQIVQFQNANLHSNVSILKTISYKVLKYRNIVIFFLLRLTYEIYEGCLGTCGALPLLSWTVYINGLRSRYRAGIQKFHPELKESIGSSLTYAQNVKATLPEAMVIVTNYLNWMDSEGFKVVGSTMDSSVYNGGVTKTHVYTLQMPDLSVP